MALDILKSLQRPAPQAVQSGQRLRLEPVLLTALLLLVLALNLLVGVRSPLVWEDEISASDPAVNLPAPGFHVHGLVRAIQDAVLGGAPAFLPAAALPLVAAVWFWSVDSPVV